MDNICPLTKEKCNEKKNCEIMHESLQGSTIQVCNACFVALILKKSKNDVFNLVEKVCDEALDVLMNGDNGMSKRKCVCGTTLAILVETGKIGCSQCYTTFSDQIVPILGRCQKSLIHVGRTPSRLDIDHRVSQLEEELKESIKVEDYEKSAIIRDKIKEIKLEQQERLD